MPTRSTTQKQSRDRLARRPFSATIGPWQLVRLVGVGHWTEVFQARPSAGDNTDAADYTLKLLKAEFQHDPTAIELLQREAFVAAQVRNPHLATILSAHVERAPRFVVLPFMPGATIEQAIAVAGHINVPHALWLARQVAEGLRALHAGGWLHGDVKPANILVSETGHATLLDLGFARRIPAASPNDDLLAASLSYAPPEAFNPNVPFSPASDIYSLGITLFEMLTGQRPFPEDDACELAAAHLVKPLPDPRAWRPQLPSRVLRLLRRMLAKEPLRRPSVDELIDWLVELEVEALDERVAAL